MKYIIEYFIIILTHKKNIVKKLLGKLFSKKAVADDEGAKAIYPEFMDYFGKKECELERYFNQCFFNYMNYYIFSASNTSKTEFIL